MLETLETLLTWYGIQNLQYDGKVRSETRGTVLVTFRKMGAPGVTAYFDLLSYLYLSRLIHDTSLIIPELSVLPDCLYRSYICTRARVNAYRTYPLSRYSATILLNAHSPWSTHSESYPPLYL